MKKRICSLLLAVVMLLGMIPAVSAAQAIVQQGQCGDNLTWTLNDQGELHISGTGPMNNYAPDENSQAPWMKYQNQIKTVRFDEGITTIGDCAFGGCKILTGALVLPSTLKTIGFAAFAKCPCVGPLTIPQQVTEIGEYAFYECNGLTGELRIPDSVTQIGRQAFAQCQKLVLNGENGLGKGLKIIGDFAFECVSAKGNLVLPAQLTEIGDQAFSGIECKDVFIPASVRKIGGNPFLNNRIETIHVDEANSCYQSKDNFLLTKDGKKVVSAAGAKQELRVPDGVTTFGERAIWGCSCHSITLPASLTTFEYTSVLDYSFYTCNSLTEIVVDPANPKFQGKNGLLLTADGETVLDCAGGIRGTVVIPDGVVNLYAKWLGMLAPVSNLYLPISVKKIDFLNAMFLTDVYYAGTQSDREKMQIRSFNVNNATWHYNSSAPHIHEGSLVPAREATCTERGKRSYYHCDGCGKNFEDSRCTVEIPNLTKWGIISALGHNWGEWTQTKPATQTETGLEKRECGRCHVEETREIPKLGHVHTATLVKGQKADCVTAGMKSYYHCDDCGKNFEDADCTVEISDVKAWGTLPALGHDWGSWIIVVQATADTDGLEKRECSRCHGTETKVIPASGETPVVPDYKPFPGTPSAKPERPEWNGEFTDVVKSDYFYDAVHWAVSRGITTGVDASRFAPNAACTRAQAVTFLWRAAGSPEADSRENIFLDVTPGDYYYDAVLWAVENGITKGATTTTFSPDTPCTRAQIVTFLHRTENPVTVNTVNSFMDVQENDYFAQAVSWATEKEITNGTAANTFSPEMPCTRGQIVTFLYRNETK